jgi:DNA repair ATPase RecN
VLIEMRLENYAVIDNLAVEFGQGLNLLTGETGAGKSILVDALALLLGDKASSDVIRTGAERAMVSAVFEAEGAAEKPLAGILEANGLDESDDGALILRREIAAGGKGRVFVNNQPATVAVLRLLAPYLATVHAQNESLSSFDGSTRLGLLDTFAERLRGVERDPHPHRRPGAGRAGPVAAGGPLGFPEKGDRRGAVAARRGRAVGDGKACSCQCRKNLQRGHECI